MKYLVLALALLVPNSIVVAHNYPLSPESQQFIINSAIGGAIVGGGLGLIAACVEQSNSTSTKPKTTWEKVKSFPWLYVVIPALVGAAGAGFIASHYTTEEYLKSAENELTILESDIAFDRINCENASPDRLKELAYNADYPTITSCGKVDSLLLQVRRAKDYLVSVTNSGIAPLVNVAKSALDRIKEYEQKLISMMTKLKNDGLYHKEILTRAQIAHNQQMAYEQGRIAAAAQRTASAAQESARAAQSAANAAWQQVNQKATNVTLITTTKL